MVARTRQIITEASRRFPVRVRIAVPPDGFGQRLNRMRAWLDENGCTDDGMMTPFWSSGRGRRCCGPSISSTLRLLQRSLHAGAGSGFPLLLTAPSLCG
jgi:hypothetical protein